MVSTLRRIGHRPKKRGGNGTGLTETQAQLLAALGEEWKAEFAIPTRIKRGNGYPTCYKVDLALPSRMIAIEIDGRSHSMLSRKFQDQKKDALLAQLGWRVFRVSNARAGLLFTTLKSADILLTSLMES